MAAIFSWASSSLAQAKSDYLIEVTPTLGRNLPYHVWGADNSLAVYGVRAATPLNNKGALEAGFLYSIGSGDKARTFDFGYRYETVLSTINFILDVGLHISKFTLKTDYTSLGTCIPSDCSNDSGVAYGYYFGGGLQVPLSPQIPLRIRMRFYKNPSLWLLLEMGMGLRF